MNNITQITIISTDSKGRICAVLGWADGSTSAVLTAREIEADGIKINGNRATDSLGRDILVLRRRK